MSTEDMTTPFKITHFYCTNYFTWFKQGIVMNDDLFS